MSRGEQVTASPSRPREIQVRELEVGSWATFDPIYGPEKVPVDGFAQYGMGVEVVHLQVSSRSVRFITRAAYEPILEVSNSDEGRL